jgi:hypothetical protein
MDFFFNDDMLYSFHGTHPNNVSSILKNGLKAGGTNINGKTIEIANGSCFGAGVYTSKIPLYA